MKKRLNNGKKGSGQGDKKTGFFPAGNGFFEKPGAGKDGQNGGGGDNQGGRKGVGQVGAPKDKEKI